MRVSPCADSVLINSDAEASTWTVSALLLRLSKTLRGVELPATTPTWFSRVVPKPPAVTVTVYDPIGTSEVWNAPEAFVITWKVVPVDSPTTLTVAPEMIAPVGSTTEPLIPPVIMPCPYTALPQNTSRRIIAENAPTNTPARLRSAVRVFRSVRLIAILIKAHCREASWRKATGREKTIGC